MINKDFIVNVYLYHWFNNGGGLPFYLLMHLLIVFVNDNLERIDNDLKEYIQNLSPVHESISNRDNVAHKVLIDEEWRLKIEEGEGRKKKLIYICSCCAYFKRVINSSSVNCATRHLCESVSFVYYYFFFCLFCSNLFII